MMMVSDGLKEERATNKSCSSVYRDTFFELPEIHPVKEIPDKSLSFDGSKSKSTTARNAKEGSSEESTSNADSSVSGTTSRRATSSRTFPEKLMDLLLSSITDPDIAKSIAWLPHGRSFEVCDPEKFSKDILPTYFKQAKFSSFTRKLYRWGFRHITKGPDANSFYHELFRRDNTSLCQSMFCTYSDGVVRNRRAKIHLGHKEQPRQVNESSRKASFKTKFIPFNSTSNPFLAGKTNKGLPPTAGKSGTGLPSIEMQLQLQKLQMQKLEMQQMQLQLQKMQMQIQLNAQMMGVNNTPSNNISSNQMMMKKGAGMVPNRVSISDEDMFQSGFDTFVSCEDMTPLQIDDSNGSGHSGFIETSSYEDSAKPFEVCSNIMPDPIDDTFFDFPKKVVSSDESSVIGKEAYIARLRHHRSGHEYFTSNASYRGNSAMA